jgi:hypothetical protein
MFVGLKFYAHLGLRFPGQEVQIIEWHFLNWKIQFKPKIMPPMSNIREWMPSLSSSIKTDA